jgi:hypothetical protein
MDVFVIETIYKNLSCDRKLTEKAEANINRRDFFTWNNIFISEWEFVTCLAHYIVKNVIKRRINADKIEKKG